MTVARLRTMLVGLALVQCATPPSGPSVAPVRLAIVATADLHGHAVGRLQENGLVLGGLATFGGYVENLRATGPVLLLDAGDMWHGTLLSNRVFGEPMVKAMNALGFAAAALGNHEFDWGIENLRRRAAESAFPILAANLVDAGTGRLPAWEGLAPSTMVEAGGVKVGVVGLATLDTPIYQRQGTLDGLRFEPLLASATAAAKSLRAAGAAVVVLLAHEGGECRRHPAPAGPKDCDLESPLFALVRQLPPGLFDVAIGGHTHHAFALEFAGMAVVQAGSKGRQFARVDLTLVPGKSRVKGVKVFPLQPVCAEVFPETGSCRGEGGEERRQAHYADRPVSAVSSVEALLAPYEEAVAALRSRSLEAVAARPLTHDYRKESVLGNLITDALLTVPGVDVAAQNGGGIRADVDAGPLTFGEIYDVLPFGNRISLVRLSGSQLIRFFELGVRVDHGLMQLAGVRLDVLRCTAGGVRVNARFSDGRLVSPDAMYTLATNDYIGGGGDGFGSLWETLPAGSVETLDEGLLERVITYLGSAVEPWHRPEEPLLDPKSPRITIGSGACTADQAGAEDV